MKTTKELRERLEQAASISGRALTHEVESRLNRTFEYDYLMGEGDTALVLRAVAAGIKRTENAAGDTWPDNPAIQGLCFKMASEVLRLMMEPEPRQNKLLAVAGERADPAAQLALQRTALEVALEHLEAEQERVAGRAKPSDA